MAKAEALIEIDTSQIDKATVKVENLMVLIEKIYKLSEKSWLIRFLLGIKNDR